MTRSLWPSEPPRLHHCSSDGRAATPVRPSDLTRSGSLHDARARSLSRHAHTRTGSTTTPSKSTRRSNPQWDCTAFVNADVLAYLTACERRRHDSVGDVFGVIDYDGRRPVRPRCPARMRDWRGALTIRVRRRATRSRCKQQRRGAAPERRWLGQLGQCAAGRRRCAARTDGRLSSGAQQRTPRGDGLPHPRVRGLFACPLLIDDPSFGVFVVLAGPVARGAAQKQVHGRRTRRPRPRIVRHLRGIPAAAGRASRLAFKQLRPLGWRRAQ